NTIRPSPPSARWTSPSWPSPSSSSSSMHSWPAGSLCRPCPGVDRRKWVWPVPLKGATVTEPSNKLTDTMHSHRAVPARRGTESRVDDAPVVPSPGPSFARGLWRIAAADVSSNNRVRLLRDGPATFDAMVELIEHARTSVALESYIFRSDEVGHRLGEALTSAAGRGVAARLLLDYVGIRGTSRAFLRQLTRAGVDV